MEAIKKIIRSSNNCVLVCCNSNSACDEIAGRLSKWCKPGEIFRMFAKSHSEKKVDPKILKYSNFVKGQFRFPSLKYLYRFRLVICTLLTAGCISRARENREFNPGHFSHIFVDEGASTNETTTLIAIAGIFNFISFF